MKTRAPVPDVVVCPACRRGSLDLPWDENGTVPCGECAATYPVRDSVLNLLPDFDAPRSLAQAVMESETVVRIYESRLWRRSMLATLAMGISFEREQELILRAARLLPGDTVLDLACGPGIYTRPFAQGARMVVGLDLSLPMLRYASRRARELEVRNTIWIRGSALDLPFRGERFDLVNCCGALHLFPDVPRVLAAVHRVLKVGGRFTIAAFARPGGAINDWFNAQRRRFAGLNAFRLDELKTQLADAGFGGLETLHRNRRWLVLSTCKRGTGHAA